MKKPIFYILSIILLAISVYSFKIYLNNDSIKDITYQTNLESSIVIKAEIEILNGCGESGVANLYANFLRQKGFDVIESRNADNFDYLNTNILVHKKEMIPVAKNLAKILEIKECRMTIRTFIKLY